MKVTKLKLSEFCFLTATLVFVLCSLAWFFYQNQERELNKIEVQKKRGGERLRNGRGS